MSGCAYQHLFGPVPSRRLGRSLGLDLVPFKTCSFDCIFCQLGRTTHLTLAREEYVPVAEIIAELDTWLTNGGTADYITLAGSGEPTLNREFGRVIEFAHQACRIPVALLTNGSLLDDPEVRRQAAKADVVKVSLSAWDALSLAHVNPYRPRRGGERARKEIATATSPHHDDPYGHGCHCPRQPPRIAFGSGTSDPSEGRLGTRFENSPGGPSAPGMERPQPQSRRRYHEDRRHCQRQNPR